ncbi:MAG TPA: flagellar hook-basal body complex protein FliE [Xanthomonadaceae bacterium]|jgi:flagellar hook-basal body complex protein FliE|nr:flagellar hook-basal body complex protein FliE [Xanthomonadaceae bacterium]
MTIEPISGANVVALPNHTSPQATQPTDFGQMLSDGISKVDSGLQVADQQLRAMAAGKGVEVQDVMISMEKARMNLMFMVEVRNRAVDAYQELMRMQL